MAFKASLLLLLAAAGHTGAQDPPPALPEYVLKAGFLYNFAKYVEWPADAFERADSPIVIGIVGADPFGDRIDAVLRDKGVRGRKFEIRRYPDSAALQRCHIVFVARGGKDRVADILERTRGWSALTVGEDASFPEAGGILAILVERDKPRLVVNPDAADRARLVIDSKLLRVATIVRGAR
jgi:hypothetical protein